MTEPTAPRDPTQPGPVTEARLRAGQELARAQPELPRHEAEAVQQSLAAEGGAAAVAERERRERRERRLERQIAVRQVTHVQASWTERERGAPGAFTLQLILDHGAAEYVLRPTAQDAQVLLALLRQGERAVFDLDRKVLVFGTLALE
jgi:hypothetical protein